MTPRLYLELALIAIAAGFGWGYVHQRDDRLRAEGRLELVEARADSTAKAAVEAVAASVQRDSAAAAALRHETETRVEAERRAARAAARLPAAADSVVAAAAPADSAAVRARLAELAAVYEERDRARLDRIASDSIVISELRAVHMTDLAAIASLQSALAAAQDVGRTALETRPGWIQRNAPKVLVPIAFAVGVVVGERFGH